MKYDSEMINDSDIESESRDELSNEDKICSRKM